MTLTFQISHAEFLLLLGLMELPRPFALGQGTPPSRSALEGALSAAAGSLAARDLLTLPSQANMPPTPHPELAALVRTVALAENMLIVASGPPTRLSHLSWSGRNIVLHSSPAPDVHRLEAIASPEQAVQQVMSRLLPSTLAEPMITTPLRMSGETLLTAFNALQRGDEAAAASALQQSCRQQEAARVFVETIGPQPARYALAALRGARQSQPEARGALVIAGQTGGWWAAPASDNTDSLLVWPVGLSGLQARVSELGLWICEAA